MFKSLPLVAGGCLLAAHGFVRRVTGKMPPPGVPVVIAANHSSLFDGLVICTELTWRRYGTVHPITTTDAFVNPFYGWILRSIKAIPIDRSDHVSAVTALTTALGYLKRGEPVTIFPEGHLNNGKSLRLPRPGMALLALESGAAVLPVGLRNTAEAFPPDKPMRFRRCVEIHIGEPLPTAELSDRYHASDAPGRQKLVESLSYHAMAKIAELSGQTLHRRMRPPAD